MKSCITCKKNKFNWGDCESKEFYAIFPNDLESNDCKDYVMYLQVSEEIHNQNGE